MGTFEFHPPVSDDDAINALALARAATRLRARGNECLLRQSGDLPHRARFTRGCRGEPGDVGSYRRLFGAWVRRAQTMV